MPITRPCIVGRMGTTTYYETTMTARELTNSVRPARETDDWASASIEERIQRDVNMGRIRQTIVPYLAQHPDRFFGSFIVLVEPGAIEFEKLTDLDIKLPAAYRRASDNIGFLTIDKGELIALDGQHRLLSFREVITGGAQLGPFTGVVGDDEVCVLFIEFESAQKTRRIFNKVNRHAKPTGRSDNIIMSEDDGFAIIARRLLDRDLEAPLAAREIDGVAQELVNWTSNTLSHTSTRLTTISAVYETVTDILTFEGFRGFSEKENPVAPDDQTLATAYDVAASLWEQLLELDALKNALADLGSVANVRFSNTHRHTLLLRPVGQVALVKGLVLAVERSKGTLTLSEAIRRANRVDWSASGTSIWRDSIVRPDGRMVARREAYDLAARLLAHLIADEFMSEEERKALWQDWNQARGRNYWDPIEDLPAEQIPEDLPTPVARNIS